MADELDLEHGDPSVLEDTATPRRRRRSTASEDRPPTNAQLDSELNKRITSAFDQVVEWREAREDFELATAISEDKDKMARGLVSLTHVINPVRKPLIIFLAFVEPVLAFGRVGRILTQRFVERRARIIEERQAMMQEQEPVPVQTWGDGAVVNP